MIVSLFYATLKSSQTYDNLQQYLSLLSESEKAKIIKYKQAQDRIRRIYGKMLLLQGLRRFGKEDQICQIEYTQFNKPFIANSLKFNISHSGNYVVCAVNELADIGVDIEQICHLPLPELRHFCSAFEWKKIEESDNPLNQFYTFWTKKEAVLKADGRGLSVNLNELDSISDKISIDSRIWHLKQIILDDNYICHIASDIAIDSVSLNFIEF